MLHPWKKILLDEFNDSILLYVRAHNLVVKIFSGYA